MKAAVYNPYWDTLGGGERYVASLIHLLLDQKWQVDVWWPNDICKSIHDRFSLDISEAKFTKKSPSSAYDLLFWLSDGSLPVSFAKNTLIHFQFPFKNVSGHSPTNWLKSRFYKFVVNSSFTKTFIDTEFSVNSQVIYPPVSVSQFKRTEKIPQILYVGRFSNLTQSKGQTALIEEFKKIYKQLPGWKLVLAGGTSVGTDKNELSRLKESIRGLPIQIILDPDFPKLQKLYGESSLYWSASGFGVNENATPLKVEHFGISVVEAMAAGGVPLVTNLGGHREIICSGQDGFLWDTTEELGKFTINLINNPRLLSDMSQHAIVKSKIFDITQFNEAFSKILHV